MHMNQIVDSEQLKIYCVENGLFRNGTYHFIPFNIVESKIIDKKIYTSCNKWHTNFHIGDDYVYLKYDHYNFDCEIDLFNLNDGYINVSFSLSNDAFIIEYICDTIYDAFDLIDTFIKIIPSPSELYDYRNQLRDFFNSKLPIYEFLNNDVFKVSQ